MPSAQQSPAESGPPQPPTATPGEPEPDRFAAVQPVEPLWKSPFVSRLALAVVASTSDASSKERAPRSSRNANVIAVLLRVALKSTSYCWKPAGIGRPFKSRMAPGGGGLFCANAEATATKARTTINTKLRFMFEVPLITPMILESAACERWHHSQLLRSRSSLPAVWARFAAVEIVRPETARTALFFGSKKWVPGSHYSAPAGAVARAYVGASVECDAGITTRGRRWPTLGAPGTLDLSRPIWPSWCDSCSQTWNHLHRLLVGPQGQVLSTRTSQRSSRLRSSASVLSRRSRKVFK